MKTNKRTVTDLHLHGKKVLMRIDANVPLDDGSIVDNTRILAALPTIRHVLDQSCPLILMSHLGRPGGVRVDQLSLRPVARELADKLNCTVKMAPDWFGAEVEDMARELQPGEILMLENTRFHAVEEGKDGVLEEKAKKLKDQGDPRAAEARKEADQARARLRAAQPGVAKQLAAIADVYINDAFGSAHRRHVSTAIIAEHVDECAIGMLMKQELDSLSRVLADDVPRPMIAIVGGAKISGKLEVLNSFLGRMDAILIGGGMAYTLMLAREEKIGDSIHEPALVRTAKDIRNKAGTKDATGKRWAELVLPVDHVVATSLDDDAKTDVVTGAISAGWRGVDIGPDTIKLYADRIKSAKTVVWNGPMGIFERPSFAGGTMAIAAALAESEAYCIVGGGDSVTAVNRSGYADQMNHISTGGGASLEFLAGIDLPGVAVIPNR